MIEGEEKISPEFTYPTGYGFSQGLIIVPLPCGIPTVPGSPFTHPESLMHLLIQRVAQASVQIDSQIHGSIGPGLLAFICAEPAEKLDIFSLIPRYIFNRIFIEIDYRNH